MSRPKKLSNKFPKTFFAGVIAAVILVMLGNTFGYRIMPRNTTADCRTQFKSTNRTKAGYEFCDCIHKYGEPLHKAIERYNKAPDDAKKKPQEQQN